MVDFWNYPAGKQWQSHQGGGGDDDEAFILLDGAFSHPSFTPYKDKGLYLFFKSVFQVFGDLRKILILLAVNISKFHEYLLHVQLHPGEAEQDQAQSCVLTGTLLPH